MKEQSTSAELLEIKARIRNHDEILQKLEAMEAIRSAPVDQDDTFFACQTGRLKLRRLGPANGMLIHYERDDIAGPKHSSCSLVQTESPDALRETLQRALGIKGRVRKRRLNFTIGIAQIHLDTVDGLGDFVEIEVDAGGDNEKHASRILAALIKELEINDADLLECAYVDMLLTFPAEKE